MDALFHLDYWLFNLVNQEWSNAFFDIALKWMRNEWIWFPLYLFIIAFFIFNFKKNAYWLILFSFITFGTSDFLSSQLIKKVSKGIGRAGTKM
ncbi:MAG: hypothetical protein IPN29_10035 [Saprospiraceae bacterium]|nr:hypothetical protein [Saprospiraceae bacterium]